MIGTRLSARCWILVAAPAALAATVASANIIDLPRTGATSCWTRWGFEVPCAGTGQDGEHQAGVGWPDPRFTDNGDGTITDELTGLMWLQDVDCLGTAAWEDVPGRVADLNATPGVFSCAGYTAGLSDWRTPNINELLSLRPYASDDSDQWLADQGFVNVATVAPPTFWTSTPYTSLSPTAWYVWIPYFSFDVVGVDTVLSVLAVRGGAKGEPDPAYPANTGATGRTTCRLGGDEVDCAGTGQDGELQWGVTWPSPRFVDNGDGTVTDHLTGLMWLQQTQCFGIVDWETALDSVASFNSDPAPYACANYTAGYTDWRMPNVVELRSLLYHERSGPAISIEAHDAFVQVLTGTAYWTSTSTAHAHDWAHTVELMYGYSPGADKDHLRVGWAVRGNGIAALLYDGFESGDTTRWSAQTP